MQRQNREKSVLRGQIYIRRDSVYVCRQIAVAYHYALCRGSRSAGKNQQRKGIRIDLFFHEAVIPKVSKHFPFFREEIESHSCKMCLFLLFLAFFFLSRSFLAVHLNCIVYIPAMRSRLFNKIFFLRCVNNGNSPGTFYEVLKFVFRKFLVNRYRNAGPQKQCHVCHIPFISGLTDYNDFIGLFDFQNPRKRSAEVHGIVSELAVCDGFKTFFLVKSFEHKRPLCVFRR